MEPDQEQLVRLQNSRGHRVALHSANLLVLKQGPLCQEGPDALRCNKTRVIKRSRVARETVRSARLSKAEKLLFWTDRDDPQRSNQPGTDGCMLGLRGTLGVPALTCCDIQHERRISASADNLCAGNSKPAEFPAGGTAGGHSPHPHPTPTELFHIAQGCLSSPTHCQLWHLRQQQEHADGFKR